MSELITVSSIDEIGNLVPELILLTSWLEQMKILLTILQNSLQQHNNTNPHSIYSNSTQSIIEYS